MSCGRSLKSQISNQLCPAPLRLSANSWIKAYLYINSRTVSQSHDHAFFSKLVPLLGKQQNQMTMQSYDAALAALAITASANKDVSDEKSSINAAPKLATSRRSVSNVPPISSKILKRACLPSP